MVLKDSASVLEYVQTDLAKYVNQIQEMEHEKNNQDTKKTKLGNTN